MPIILELFLSKYVFLILTWMYLIAGLSVAFGFKWLKINRRKDVKIRGTIMHGTFIFLSHSIGVIVLSILYLFLKINSIELNKILLSFLIVIVTVIADIIYFFMSNYLWDRLAIDRNKSIKLSLYSLIITTPWYFMLNLI